MTQAWFDGNLYDEYMGRWSRLVAPRFLEWFGVSTGQHWLDVGCGTGALSQVILDRCNPRLVVGIDRSDAFVAAASARISDARVHFRAGDAMALPVSSAGFDFVVSGLMLNFVPDPAVALAELKRAAAPGGRIGVYVWDYAGGMEWLRIFWQAAADVNHEAQAMSQIERYAICNPAALRSLFEEADLGEVVVQPLDVEARFRDFDDYWQPFAAAGPFPAPTYLASRPEGEREAIRAILLERLPQKSDGSIVIGMRAWAAKGVS